MPISTRVLSRRNSEAGKIKIGGRSGQERVTKGGTKWRAPEKFENQNGPYFVVTKTTRDTEGANFVVDTQIMTALKAMGCCDEDGQLRRIPIMFSSGDIDENFRRVLRVTKAPSGGVPTLKVSTPQSATTKKNHARSGAPAIVCPVALVSPVEFCGARSWQMRRR